MADVFTLVVLRDHDTRKLVEMHEGRFQIRYHEDGRCSVVERTGSTVDGEEYGDFELWLAGARVTSIDEAGVEITGFQRTTIHRDQFKPVMVVLTRPGTGWDGKEPT